MDVYEKCYALRLRWLEDGTKARCSQFDVRKMMAKTIDTKLIKSTLLYYTMCEGLGHRTRENFHIGHKERFIHRSNFRLKICKYVYAQSGTYGVGDL